MLYAIRRPPLNDSLCSPTASESHVNYLWLSEAPTQLPKVKPLKHS